MLRGLLRLTWIELKVFMREPLGAVGSIVMPVLVFLLMGRLGRNISAWARSPIRADPDFDSLSISSSRTSNSVSLCAATSLRS